VRPDDRCALATPTSDPRTIGRREDCGRAAPRTDAESRFAEERAGGSPHLWLLLLFILALLVLGVWGAIKLALWVILIALAVALVVTFLGRGAFVR
jgi:hypothetical protein